MWCDTFDADLLRTVPGAVFTLGPAADVPLLTYSWPTGGKINCPSVWNGVGALFWTGPEHRPDATFHTEAPITGCTFLEAVRDEWVHSCAIVVNRQLVWRPPWQAMQRLMFDLRGWGSPLADSDREAIQASVRLSLEAAAVRLTAVVARAGQ